MAADKTYFTEALAANDLPAYMPELHKRKFVIAAVCAASALLGLVAVEALGSVPEGHNPSDNELSIYHG